MDEQFDRLRLDVKRNKIKVIQDQSFLDELNIEHGDKRNFSRSSIKTYHRKERDSTV